MKNIKDEICEVNFIDEKKVLSVREKIKSDYIISRLAETFKVLGDPTRTKIILALSFDELCVCDIASLLGTTKS
ncbi:MAG: ArsR family transcriptional regulator, partial [Elusimicrobiales bacterium]|nr:ArsR family transcriptional regulator [Elusimicrobiales bacterium]